MKQKLSYRDEVSKPPFGVRFLDFVDATMAYLGAKEQINEAFAVADWLATYLWENISGTYRLDQLEEILATKLEDEFNHWTLTTTPRPGELHVATELYRAGGHTPLAANLIELAPTAVDVLLTRMTNVEMAAAVLRVSPACIHSVGDIQEMPLRVKAMVDMMIRYDRVILHIHPNDVACAVAVRFAKRLRPAIQVCFVNHADHVFSVGIGAADRVFEVSTYGWGLRAARRTEDTSSFIGLPIKRPQREDHVQSIAAPVTFLTGAAPSKFRPHLGMALPPVLDRLLDAQPRSRLTVVGPWPTDWWWLPLRVKHFRRVQFSRFLPKEAYRTLLDRCSVYIDSYPTTGGTAFPEALMSGCNVAGIRGAIWGYSFADELLSADTDTFIRNCAELVSGNEVAIQRQQSVRERCIEYHGPAAVRARLDQSLVENRLLDPPPGQLKHLPNPMLEAIWQAAESPQVLLSLTLRLTLSDRKWLAREHRKVFGMGSASRRLMLWATAPVYVLQSFIVIDNFA